MSFSFLTRKGKFENLLKNSEQPGDPLPPVTEPAALDCNYSWVFTNYAPRMVHKFVVSVNQTLHFEQNFTKLNYLKVKSLNEGGTKASGFAVQNRILNNGLTSSKFLKALLHERKRFVSV
jgi:hypothetical protein